MYSVPRLRMRGRVATRASDYVPAVCRKVYARMRRARTYVVEMLAAQGWHAGEAQQL